jgi:hypothetical protein
LNALTLIARPHLHYDALVVDHGAAAAYCLPGRVRQVVLTSAALSALDHNQLLGVLAHEQAHLRGPSQATHCTGSAPRSREDNRRSFGYGTLGRIALVPRHRPRVRRRNNGPVPGGPAVLDHVIDTAHPTRKPGSLFTALTATTIDLFRHKKTPIRQ